MDISVPRLVAAGVAIIALALAATVVGITAGILAKIDGGSWPSALSKGAISFGGAFTLGLAVLAFMGTWPQ